MEDIILFEDKKDCCGCGACFNVCPKHAIHMQEDEYGFAYPKIDSEKCIKCGACKKVCGFQKTPVKKTPVLTYAAADKDDRELKKSASGGAFIVLAKNILKDHGVVYGAALLKQGKKLVPMHMRVDSVRKLKLLQGSKYVQSDLANTYQSAKTDLQEGITVLFSGTPCQIAGLKGFLGKEYENLLTVEIICHGVPGVKMFQDFINFYSDKLGGEIEQFYFRDKSRGQGYITKTIWVDSEGKKREKIKTGELFAYIHFFSKSLILRKNCYSCPFACKERIADLTIGDYWGFHEEYPSLPKNYGLSNQKGVSCILVNSEQGKWALSQCKEELILLESELSKIAKHNAQLNEPSPYRQERETVLELYKKQGYEALEDYYQKNFKLVRMKYRIAGIMPKGLKNGIKKTVHSIKN